MGQGIRFGSSAGRGNGAGPVNGRIIAAAGFFVIILLMIGVPLIVRAPKTENVNPVPAGPDTSVFIPIQRIPIAVPLLPTMFRKDNIELSAYQALGNKVVKTEADLLGRYSKVVLSPGKPLTSDQMVDAPQNPLAQKIRPGYRAVTIKVDDVSGIEGWGTPGARVDVLWATQNNGEFVATTIVKNAQVLSVMGRVEPPPQVANLPVSAKPGLIASNAPPPTPLTSFTVTMLVTPDDGQKLFVASVSGKLSLMLRSEFDGGQDAGGTGNTSSKRLLVGGASDQDNPDKFEGSAKVRRSDGSVDEWTVVEGRVLKWDQVH